MGLSLCTQYKNECVYHNFEFEQISISNVTVRRFRANETKEPMFAGEHTKHGGALQAAAAAFKLNGIDNCSPRSTN